MKQVEDSNKVISAVVVLGDIIAINILFLVFYYLLRDKQELLFQANLPTTLLSFSISYLISSTFKGVILYYRRVRPDQIVRNTISRMFVFLLVWFLLVSALDLGIELNRYTSAFFLAATLLVIVMRLSFYNFLRYTRMKGRNRCRVIYIGSSSNLVELYNEMAQQLSTGYEVLGYFDKNSSNRFNDKCPYLGSAEEAIAYLSKNKVDRVYCGLPSKDSHLIVPIINHCEGHMVRFFSVPNFRNYCHRRVNLEMFSNVPLLSIREEPLSLPLNRYAKRAFDVLFSGLFLLVGFLPILIVVGIITTITSPGPIFFMQERHGLDGKTFKIFKFRSMKINKESDMLQATEDDPRKTKFGDFLRRTSIDELPQFINVFIGNMSIVGPRPHMVKHTEEYSQLIKTYMVRHLAKPGVTGWAQVTGFRGETKELADMEGRIRADIWYIEHWTFTLDLYIIFRTVANVVMRKDKNAF